MKYIVVYTTEYGRIGNVDCDFISEPPSMKNIRDVEKDIGDKFCNGERAVIVNWMKIS